MSGINSIDKNKDLIDTNKADIEDIIFFKCFPYLLPQ